MDAWVSAIALHGYMGYIFSYNVNMYFKSLFKVLYLLFILW